MIDMDAAILAHLAKLHAAIRAKYPALSSYPAFSAGEPAQQAAIVWRADTGFVVRQADVASAVATYLLPLIEDIRRAGELSRGDVKKAHAAIDAAEAVIAGEEP